MQSVASFNIEGVGLDVADLSRPIDWAGLFGNANPVELEIGSGKGTFLVNQATVRPGVNFFGIEWSNWFFRYAADRMRRRCPQNTRMIRADANFFIREFVPDRSIAALHIYFPDPWPKTRHNRRRMVQPSFVPEMRRILQPGGRVQIVTDHRGYFDESIYPTMQNSGMKLVDYARNSEAGDGEQVGTNFERKYLKEGRSFFAIAAENC